MVESVDYGGVKFPVSKKDYSKIEKKNSICINVFGYEMVWCIWFMYHETFEDYMGLLLMTDGNKSHYVYIKDVTDLCVIRQNIRIKNTFADIVCSGLSERVLVK